MFRTPAAAKVTSLCEIASVFRETRDEIRARVQTLAARYKRADAA